MAQYPIDLRSIPHCHPALANIEDPLLHQAVNASEAAGMPFDQGAAAEAENTIQLLSVYRREDASLFLP